MRENRLRALWAEDKAVVNGWLAIPAGFSAETMAHCGWDSLTVDLQHGMADYAQMVAMLTAISTTAVTPLVRVPWLEPGTIMRALDAGAYGVICPMVNSAAEARALVAATRYTPAGARSFGPIRAAIYGGPDYAERANDTIVNFAMIETREALDDLDAILAAPGLDAIYVGPTDLSLSLGGKPRMDQEEGPLADAVAHIVTRCQAHGVIAGIHTGSPAYARKVVAMGYRFVTIASDARFLAAAATEAVAEMRRGLPG